MTGGYVPERNQMLSAQDLVEVSPFINGRHVPSFSSERFTIYNPSTGARLADLPRGSREDADHAVSAARAAFRSGVWSKAPPSRRKSTLHRWADLIAADAPRLDALDALEMGKPVSVRFANAAAAAGLARFYAEALDKIPGEVLPSDFRSSVLSRPVPRGVVAAVVPWNFPAYNAILKVAPALAVGNSVVLKPSELASQSALALGALALEAGLPPGVLNVVPGCGETVGRALGEHMDVDMLTFTGSSAVGRRMLEYAGRSNMKVVSAECGGKSPHIVFDDGLDLGEVADFITQMLVTNQGQVCSVGSRLLVQDTLEEALVQRLILRLQQTVAGDPQLPQTSYGPLVSRAQWDKVLQYIALGSEDGADLVHGGAPLLPETGGYFLEPAVFVNVPERSRIAQEEIFGPVLAVLRFHDAEEAIRLANSTPYALAAYVWTARLETGFQMAGAVDAAYTLINGAVPSGEGPGYALSCEPSRLSGVGPEGGLAGMASYTRRQTVWFNH